MLVNQGPLLFGGSRLQPLLPKRTLIHHVQLFRGLPLLHVGEVGLVERDVIALQQRLAEELLDLGVVLVVQLVLNVELPVCRRPREPFQEPASDLELGRKAVEPVK